MAIGTALSLEGILNMCITVVNMYVVHCGSVSGGTGSEEVLEYDYSMRVCDHIRIYKATFLVQTEQ